MSTADQLVAVSTKEARQKQLLKDQDLVRRERDQTLLAATASAGGLATEQAEELMMQRAKRGRMDMFCTTSSSSTASKSNSNSQVVEHYIYASLKFLLCIFL